MSKEYLQAFMDEKKVRAQKEKKDWGKLRDEWLGYLEGLYNNIEIWLTDIKDKDIKYTEVDLNEQHIGAYKARSMLITIVDDQISLNPVGTVLIGAKGRVDMIGSMGKVQILLVPTCSSTKAGISCDKQKWSWKLSTSPPIIRYIELDEDSFSDALLEVIE